MNEFIGRVGERYKIRGLPSILSPFHNEFNEFNNKRALTELNPL